MSNIQKLRLDEINILAGTQSRAETNNGTVAEYKEALEHGAEFPPVIVFSDGTASGKWLADGFHRFHAHNAAGLQEISCDVRVGTQRDAKLFSVGANASHGLRRTIEDKRRAVAMLLDDAEWSTWSDRDIARQCGVSHSFVAAVRSPAVAARQRENRQQSAVKKFAAVESDSTGEIKQRPVTVPPRPEPFAISQPPADTCQPAALTYQPAAQAAPPSLVQQVLEQQAAPAPAEQGAEDRVGEVDPFDQLMADFQEKTRECDEMRMKITELTQHVELLTRADLASQVDCLVKRAADAEYKFEQICGRNRQLQQTARDAQTAEQYQSDLLAKIRRALGVESNSEILPAISARRAA
jgi:hypothetical protein